jgi:hypothetical protein
MHYFGILALRWVLHAAVVMISVAIVSPNNPSNTLPRALFVTFVVAILVTPFAYFWFLLIPGIIALIAWWLVYTLAYGVGFGQALAAGILQSAIGFLVDFLFIHGRLG